MPPTPRTSDILQTLSRHQGERLRLGDIVSVLEDRAFALLVVILGLPNCLPMPPPIPLICGFLMLFVAGQMALGRQTPWLPKALLERSVAREQAEKAIVRAIPIFRRIERWSRPRGDVLQSDLALRLIGLALCIIAIALIGAMPFIGQLPLGFAACLIGIGLVERDGIAVLGGTTIGAIGTVLSFSFFYALFTGLSFLTDAAASW